MVNFTYLKLYTLKSNVMDTFPISIEMTVLSAEFNPINVNVTAPLEESLGMFIFVTWQTHQSMKNNSLDIFWNVCFRVPQEKKERG